MNMHEMILNRFGERSPVGIASRTYLFLLTSGQFPARCTETAQSLLCDLRGMILRCVVGMKEYANATDQTVQDDYEAAACWFKSH